LARGVEGDEPRREEGLSRPEVRLGGPQPVLVDTKFRLDRVELDLRSVVGLDDVLEVGVDGLDVCEDLPGLRLLRLDGRGGSSPGGEEGGRGEGDS
jgi:hypothetical protein